MCWGSLQKLKKNLRITKINLWSLLATRGECIFVPLKNADEGVVLVAIQSVVDSDPSAEQRHLRVQHTCSPVMSPAPSSSKEEGEVEEEGPNSSTTAWWWWSVSSPAGLRQAHAEEERCWGGEGLRLGCGAAALPPPLYL